MRAVVQRVRRAEVSVAGENTGAIGNGLLILLGVEQDDTPDDLEWLAEKVFRLRVFDDSDGRMNLALGDLPDGGALVVSQFTLFGTMRKGTRPSFHRAAPPAVALALYERFAATLAALLGKPVPTGVFGAMMLVSLENDGPVTLILDSRRRDF
ncbi:MAG: D-tyrosyl-tRNA(Tyr) deacylase [Puniceicoccales bacterium]|jgi:D-tyrosyl-tRNA(Tyr) deacylase|nr:D-tyrosyl-tRNA(Tyr) deacylase [Puniceicoccales bacterium]